MRGAQGLSATGIEVGGEAFGRRGQPGVLDRQPQRLHRDGAQGDQKGCVTVEVGDGEEAPRPGGQDGLLVGEVRGAEREDRAGRRLGVAEALSRSALENGRSQANAVPATNQVRLPWRCPSVTSGNDETSRSTSPSVAMPGPYRERRTRWPLDRGTWGGHVAGLVAVGRVAGDMHVEVGRVRSACSRAD